MIIIQLQPAIQIANASPLIQNGNITVNSTSNQTGPQVSVYIPSGNIAAQQILSQFLSDRGIKLSDFGLLSSFRLPGGNSSQIVNELNILQHMYGVKYYVSSKQPLAYPSDYQGSATPSQQTASEYVPSNIRTAYNFTYPLTHNITGKGTTIALVDAYGDPMINYDVSAFNNITGLPPINMSIIYPNNLHPTQYNRSWAIETSTDVEWAHALAPGANILLVIAPSANLSSLDNAVSYVVSNHLANIISLSWGTPETGLSTKALQTFSSVYKEAANTGISIMAATGDYGAYDQQSSPTLNFPSSSPYILAIGGTSLYPVNNHYEQSAWGGLLDGSSFGSGGGYSQYFSAPWWQVAPGFGSAFRGTPDVSMNANKNTGMLVVSQALEYKIGGTSIASPIWADVISLMDQAVNRSIGFSNPLLYQIANSPLYKSTFEDITTGNNGYYNATAGWDPVTGLGTPKVAELINATKGFLASYGSMALINGTGYNSSGITASLSVNGAPSGETYNGTTFYYIGMYENSNNFVKFGIEVNNTTASKGYIIDQNGDTLTSFTPVQKFNSSTLDFNLSLNLSHGTVISVSENGQTTAMNVFLENSGRMQMMFGTEQTGSGTNMTVIPRASFTNVTLLSSSGVSTPLEVYEMHYSGTGVSGYSTIQIEGTSNSNYSVFSTSRPSDMSLTSFTGSVGPSILYNLSYSLTPTGTFTLINSGYSSTVQWLVNGSIVSGNSTVFNRGGLYNITAKYDSYLRSISRDIYVPVMSQVNVTVSSPVQYYQNPEYVLTVNHFFKTSSIGTTTLPSISGSNSISVSSNGFYHYNSTFQTGGNISVNLKPENVTLSVFVYPGNSDVLINGTLVNGSDGMHTVSIYPNLTYVNISSNGYFRKNLSMNLIPGINRSIQVSLTPANFSNAAVVYGNVTDALYNFPVSGVNISANNSGYVYTNGTGYFVMYLPAGSYNLSFNQSLYAAKYVNLNVTSQSSVNLKVQLYPMNINPNSIYSGSVNRLFPLLFYFGYVSWTKYTGTGFAAYRVFVSENANMVNPRSITISNQNTTFAFLSGVLPGKTYHISVSVYLQNGEIYGTQAVQMSYSNPFVLLANLAIIAGVIIYGVMAVRYIGRMRKKRTIRL